MNIKKYGIIGWPVSHSLSPCMFNAAFTAAGISAHYYQLPTKAADLAIVLKNLAAENFGGVNITAPYKESVLPYLSSLSDSADKTQAVNCIVIDENGNLHGYNTDTDGFCADLKSKNIDIIDKSVAVLGAGGSARAILYALFKSGCQNIDLFARSTIKAQKLCEHFQKFFPAAVLRFSAPEKYHQDYELAINCTGDFFVGADFAQKHQLRHVYDLSYLHTDVAKKNISATYHDGLGMLLEQGALNFWLWTKRPAPLEIMRNALEQTRKLTDVR